MLIFYLLVFNLLLSCHGENSSHENSSQGEEVEEDTFSGILNGLFSAIATSTTSDCPGKCTHPLATFMCDKTLDTGCHGNQVCCVGVNKTEEGACPGACIPKDLAEKNCEKIVEGCRGGLQCCVKGGNSTDVNREGEIEGEEEEGVKKKKKECQGQCRAIIFGLFLCDEIDGEAECPESHQGCCVFHHRNGTGEGGPHNGPQSAPVSDQAEGEEQEEQEDEEEARQTPAPLPPSPQPQQSPPQPHPHPQQPPPLYPPPCPTYCLPNPLLKYCQRPLNYPCGLNGFCCAHDLRPITTTTTEPPLDYEESDELEPPPSPTPKPPTPSLLPPCPGSCINSILTFTCFLNAEVTDLFSCSNSKMRCCAPKSTLNSTTIIETTKKPPVAVVTVTPTPIIPKPINRVYRPAINNYVCGVKSAGGVPQRRKKRVVGGSDSAPGEWCWQVALINSLNQYLCGGALIGTEWVLTAAHCVTKSNEAIYIRVGDHDLTSKYGSPGAQTLRVATTYIHHNHNSQTLDNDIALLKLQGHAALKEGVCLVCLPARTGQVKEIPGKRCTVTGYGYMGESGPIPLRVREAELPIVSEPECIRKVNAVTEKVFVLPASSFCAGGEFKNDACQGDGGGPLVCQEDGYYELTGLVSWGFGCGRQDVPGVYVKVSSFIGWINQIISVNNN